MAKMKLEFDGFDKVLARISKLDGNIKGTTEKALKATHEIVTKKAAAAIKPHNKTHQIEESLQLSPKVEWAGTVASVPVGFNIEHGGLASIFLQYGTPRMDKDPKFHAAFRGAATIKEIKQAQEDIFYDEIRRLDG